MPHKYSGPSLQHVLDSLHADLRAALVARFYQVPTHILAAVLAYELTSIMATDAATEAIARDAIRKLTGNMFEQVKTHGVGGAHPVVRGLSVGD